MIRSCGDNYRRSSSRFDSARRGSSLHFRGFWLRLGSRFVVSTDYCFPGTVISRIRGSRTATTATTMLNPPTDATTAKHLPQPLLTIYRACVINLTSISLWCRRTKSGRGGGRQPLSREFVSLVAPSSPPISQQMPVLQFSRHRINKGSSGPGVLVWGILRR